MMPPPTRDAAHQAVGAAIKSGELVPGTCEHENYGTCKGAIQAHHDDYSKPLEVRWLCRRHHIRFHVDHPEVSGGRVPAPYNNTGSRTVRARIPRDLEERLDAEIERDERTESDIVRRALNAYLPYVESPVRADRDTIGATPFNGPDPRKK